MINDNYNGGENYCTFHLLEIVTTLVEVTKNVPNCSINNKLITVTYMDIIIYTIYNSVANIIMIGLV